MDIDFKDYNNRTLIKENSSAPSKSSNFPSWEDYKDSVDDIQYFLIGLYTLISLAGFMGNLLILMALMNCKQKTIISFLIGNLAFSDILVVVFCSPFTLISVLLDQWMFGKLMCHVIPFLQCVSVLVSTWMLISIAVVRYRLIRHPLSNNLTLKHGFYLILAIWTLGLAICSPLPVFYKIEDLPEALHLGALKSKHLCVESWPSGWYRIAFTISLLLMQYILPLVCLTISHTRVCKSVSSRLSGKENKLKENEMINLTLQASKSHGTQAQLSDSERRDYSFVRKHRRRYGKKTASVMPTVLRQHRNDTSDDLPEIPGTGRSQLSSSSKFIPGIPICFEVKPEENYEVQDGMTVAQTPTRIKKRSRKVFCRLTVLIIVFAVSWMPLHVFQVVTDFNGNLISNKHFKLVYCVCHLLGMMSCCLNPILYGFLNNGIKADLMALIPCLQIL
ncbi:neuropeptide Y receptor type 5 [Hemicordylus capensis]|uniref:neuropeptide Y receptor type 5 n=1 Tax=Hemicordylus capensis TaxID=884348 RepID=UPI0023025490|nr:neuropeptide Y receptor type 5 [Hemicordylus capensis]XP_053107809.1 neuropeptide Y receptor type 5 [Hemicordylus capensis]XP_053107810.1 neuropeptide Y receptor type 5 [Hemicordylus capensis]XP_053107811.1 neuropeptide Y receptor type 5 [Hemicordylus capensis]XP_053107812.1 neuropeptide Y receptor type 5 [Hemicordylus capensis]